MTNIIPLHRPSPAVTDVSVSGPWRPASAPIPIPGRPGETTDSHLRADQLARAMEARIRSLPARPSRPLPDSPPPAPPAAPRASVLARVLLISGAAVAMLGIPAGFLSIIGLGPLGLAVAAGAAALGAALIALGKARLEA